MGERERESKTFGTYLSPLSPNFFPTSPSVANVQFVCIGHTQTLLLLYHQCHTAAHIHAHLPFGPISLEKERERERERPHVHTQTYTHVLMLRLMYHQM